MTPQCKANRNTARTVTRATGFVDTTAETRTFDALNRLTANEDDDYRGAYTYGVRGLASTVYEETQQYATGTAYAKTVTTTYDGVGNRTSATYPSGLALTYAYTDVNALSSVTDGTNTIAAFTYVGFRPKVTTFGNGATETNTYGGFRSDLTTVHHETSAPATLLRMDYGYNKVHDRTYERFGAAGSAGDAFEYDKARRLTKAWLGSSTPASPSGNTYVQTIAYAMDDDGNRTSVVVTPYGVSPTTTSYTTNNLNQYTAVGGASPSYDANGNLTNDGTLTYKYNYKNLICEVRTSSGGTLVATYAYDANGRRISKDVNGGIFERYVYAGVETVSVYDGSHAWKQDFVYDVTGIDRVLMLEQKDVLDQDGDANTTELTRSYYHRNALGSVMEITTASQTEAASYRYTPYGAVTITRGGSVQSSDPLGQHWGFTARFHDAETGLTYFRARYQDPVTGRFLQRDPLGYGDSSSSYLYCRSSPAIRADPHGTTSIGPDGKVIPGTDTRTGPISPGGPPREPDPVVPSDPDADANASVNHGRSFARRTSPDYINMDVSLTCRVPRGSKVVWIQYISWFLMWGNGTDEYEKGVPDPYRDGNPAYPVQARSDYGQTMMDGPGFKVSESYAAANPDEFFEQIAAKTSTDFTGMTWFLYTSTFWAFAVDLTTHKVIDEWTYTYWLFIDRSTKPASVRFSTDSDHGNGRGGGAR